MLVSSDDQQSEDAIELEEESLLRGGRDLAGKLVSRILDHQSTTRVGDGDREIRARCWLVLKMRN